MSINGIKIDISAMTNTKSNLETDNETISQQLRNVRASMDALKGTEVWASEAATNLQAKFENLYPKFDQIHNAIEEYTIFLEKTIREYDANETVISDAARNVKDW